MPRLHDCIGKSQITGELPDTQGKASGEHLFELQALIIAALGLADDLKLSKVGIHLDQARVELSSTLEREQLKGVVVPVPPVGEG